MNKTAVVFSPKYYQHNPGKDHPESAQRLREIIKELEKGKISNRRSWQFVGSEKAELKEVELVHSTEYIKLVEAVCKSGGGLLDSGDTQVSPKSFEVALHAVGGTLKAVNLVMKGEFQNAFALVRPPGHHASRYRACGFCLFNNIAIAARHLLEDLKLRRILILDVDAHHGNGTQETFYNTNEVLFISLHEDPRNFPGTGFIDEIGEDEGLGYNVNIPLPFETGDYIYLKAMNEIVEPIIMQYKPQIILVSTGLDGHYTDPVANLSLTHLCYQRVFETVIRIASEKCNGRLVSILEGGYGLNTVGKTAATIVATMSGTSYAVRDKVKTPKMHVTRQGEKIIEEVKKVQRAFWSIT